MSLSYGCEKFYNAVSTAMVSDLSVQKRLADVYTNGVNRLGKADVPLNVWDRLNELTRALTSAVVNEGAVNATTSAMSEWDARMWLEQIAGMFKNVVEAYGIEKRDEDMRLR